MADEINPVPVPPSPDVMKLADDLKERASAALLGADYPNSEEIISPDGEVFEKLTHVVTDVPAQFPTPPQRPALLGKRL